MSKTRHPSAELAPGRPRGVSSPPGSGSDWRDWQVHVEGVALPMRHEIDGAGELRVSGVRYRCFVPTWGLHPTLAAQAAVHLVLRHPGHLLDDRVTLHEWRPDGSAYAGLPAKLAVASERRAERVALEVAPRDPGFAPQAAPEHGLGPHCLDLRCLPG